MRAFAGKVRHYLATSGCGHAVVVVSGCGHAGVVVSGCGHAVASGWLSPVGVVFCRRTEAPVECCMKL